MSVDLGPAFIKSVRAEGHAPNAVICADPFYFVKLVGDALDEVRRDLWQTLRRLPDDRYAKDFKGSRWALFKNPDDLTDTHAKQLAKIKRTKGGIWRAYEMNYPALGGGSRGAVGDRADREASEVAFEGGDDALVAGGL